MTNLQNQERKRISKYDKSCPHRFLCPCVLSCSWDFGKNTRRPDGISIKKTFIYLFEYSFFFRLTDNRQKFHSYIHSHREKQKAISEYLTFLSDGRTDGLICKDQINAASSSLDLFVVVQQMFDESIYLTSTREAVKNQINKKISQHLLSFTVQLLF